MTLIAAFRGDHGIAICADAQETCDYGDGIVYRRSVLKISPYKIGKYQIAVAGSGNGALVEAFVERAKRCIERLEATPCNQNNPASVTQIHTALEAELRTFYKNDVSLCPDEDKEVKVFIAASCPIAQQYNLWVSQYAVLRDANSPELNGWEIELYAETANRVHSGTMTVAQAALASIYTLTVAKATSNYVGGPLSVIVANKDGIWPVDAEYVRSMEDRLTDYEAGINRIFLSCADTSISVPELEDRIEIFKKAVMELHREQINRQADRTTVEELFSNSPLGKLPTPITLTGDLKLKVEHDRDTINKKSEEFRKMIKMGEEMAEKLKKAQESTPSISGTSEPKP